VQRKRRRLALAARLRLTAVATPAATPAATAKGSATGSAALAARRMVLATGLLAELLLRASADASVGLRQEVQLREQDVAALRGEVERLVADQARLRALEAQVEAQARAQGRELVALAAERAKLLGRGDAEAARREAAESRAEAAEARCAALGAAAAAADARARAQDGQRLAALAEAQERVRALERELGGLEAAREATAAAEREAAGRAGALARELDDLRARHEAAREAAAADTREAQARARTLERQLEGAQARFDDALSSAATAEQRVRQLQAELSARERALREPAARRQLGLAVENASLPGSRPLPSSLRVTNREALESTNATEHVARAPPPHPLRQQQQHAHQSAQRIPPPARQPPSEKAKEIVERDALAAQVAELIASIAALEGQVNLHKEQARQLANTTQLVQEQADRVMVLEGQVDATQLVQDEAERIVALEGQVNLHKGQARELAELSIEATEMQANLLALERDIAANKQIAREAHDALRCLHESTAEELRRPGESADLPALVARLQAVTAEEAAQRGLARELSLRADALEADLNAQKQAVRAHVDELDDSAVRVAQCSRREADILSAWENMDRERRVALAELARSRDESNIFLRWSSHALRSLSKL
jgi:hypothetical protein